MKIEQILASGYQPTWVEGYRVNAFAIDTKYRTLLLDTTGKRINVSLDLEYTSDLELQFQMVVSFNEEVAHAMLLAKVAPVESKDVLQTLARSIETMGKEPTQAISNMATLYQSALSKKGSL